MRFDKYLEATGETVTAFARRAGIPQRTAHDVREGGGCGARTAHRIIEASKAQPAPGGRIVMLEDLIPKPPEIQIKNRKRAVLHDGGSAA